MEDNKYLTEKQASQYFQKKKKNDYKIVYKARFKDSSCYKIESTKEDIH